MAEPGILLLTGPEILELFQGREEEILDAVRSAYETHEAGQSSLPHSSFLRFPQGGRDRIIALPAFLGGDGAVAGMKWIASFPGNLDRGIDRASAALILNDAETGRPTGLFESSVISAKRTAASAALAARHLTPDRSPGAVGSSGVGLVGCGLIQFEIARFLKAAVGDLGQVLLHDLDPARAAQLADRLGRSLEIDAVPATDLDQLFRASRLISFATTAVEPHVGDLSLCPPATTVLHVSLRDLTPEVILASDNLVDDVDHVCRAQTSIHLAAERSGNRDFVRGSIAQVTAGDIPARNGFKGPVVFSPFGLGVLDLALARLAGEWATQAGVGHRVDGFFPPSWTEWS